MAVVAIDTSGQIKIDRDVWVVATRRQNQLRYSAIHINQQYQNWFVQTDNWVEKLSAILFFKTSNELFKSHDIIQIDKDFQGTRAKHVEKYLKRLFGLFNYGTDRNNPNIQFIPAKYSADVREAHQYTQLARHRKGKLQVKHNPSIKKEFESLKQ
jgi:hypothetical protein